jgi:hypothetical protein
VPRRGPGGRDWESFKADPDMQALVERTLRLVRAERGAEPADEAMPVPAA